VLGTDAVGPALVGPLPGGPALAAVTIANAIHLMPAKRRFATAARRRGQVSYPG
jgi:hypothetical protein